MAESEPITQLLQKADLGDQEAANQLFALVRNDLEAIAKKCKRQAAVGDEVQTTCLVDDIFVRLVGTNNTIWQAGDRKKFFGYAAKRIHDLLIDTMRAEKAARRGGQHQRHDPRALDGQTANAGGIESLELQLDLREALAEFQEFARDEAIIFRLRYLTGCTFADIAEIMGVPETNVQRAYKKARLWLEQKLKEYHHDA
jgi:RNA polymerase sigma factor (TIGR02999 family)